MPRRSSRILNASASAPKNQRTIRSSLDAQRPVKRQRSIEDTQDKDKTPKSTPKRSKYFKQPVPESVDDEHSSPPSEVDSSPRSEYAPSDDAESFAADTNDEDEEDSTVDEGEESEEHTPKSGGRAGRNSAGIKGRAQHKGKETKLAQGTQRKELWREGVRAGLGPGKEVFIELPEARDPGDIPYEDHTIHPNTLLFLKDLKVNNDRGWLKKHDIDYRTSKKDWDTFVEKLTDKIIEKDSTIPELPAKDLVFRIYRDVRFSNDPTPYKPHFSAAWSRTGRKGPYAAYYVHLEPGKCFIGSGLWMPEAIRLALLRQDVDHRSERLKRILSHPDVRREIFGGIPLDESKVVNAFVSQNQETALKTKPKGYDAHNKNIQLLRLRSFTINKKVPDQDLLGLDALDRVANIIGIMVPFVTYLNSVVMPDPDEDGDSSENDEELDEELQ